MHRTCLFLLPQDFEAETLSLLNTFLLEAGKRFKEPPQNNDHKWLFRGFYASVLQGQVSERVKEESEKVGLKLNIQKTKIMASGPIISWEIDGETVETVSAFIF